MMLLLRHLLFLTPFVLVSFATPPAGAQGAPATRLIVPAPAGGNLDGLARKLAQSLTAGSGQTVVVENRPGASGQIGADLVARSAPDGKTLLIAGSFLSTNPLQFKGALNPVTELAPVIKLADNEIYLVAYTGLPVERAEEIREVARQRPGGLNCAAVPGQMALGCERLRVLLDGKLVPIPYPGIAPTLNAVAAGHVDLAFASYGTLKPLVESKRVRVLAVVGDKPGKPPFDHVPLLKDTWPGFVMNGYAGVFAPAGTPPALVAALNSEFNRALATPDMAQAVHELGYTRRGGSPEVLARTLAHDTAFYSRVAAEAGIVPQ